MNNYIVSTTGVQQPLTQSIIGYFPVQALPTNILPTFQASLMGTPQLTTMIQPQVQYQMQCPQTFQIFTPLQQLSQGQQPESGANNNISKSNPQTSTIQQPCISTNIPNGPIFYQAIIGGNSVGFMPSLQLGNQQYASQIQGTSSSANVTGQIILPSIQQVQNINSIPIASTIPTSSMSLQNYNFQVARPLTTQTANQNLQGVNLNSVQIQLQTPIQQELVSGLNIQQSVSKEVENSINGCALLQNFSNLVSTSTPYNQQQQQQQQQQQMTSSIQGLIMSGNQIFAKTSPTAISEQKFPDRDQSEISGENGSGCSSTTARMNSKEFALQGDLMNYQTSKFSSGTTVNINLPKKEHLSKVLDIPKSKGAVFQSGYVHPHSPQNLKEKLMFRIGIPYDTKMLFEEGADVDLSTLEKSLHVPNLRTFKYVKYFKPESKRWTQVFLCEFQGCQRSFKKWHNLFDHLRSHTQEKPFVCPVLGCSQPFTQKSNLNKHMRIHRNKCYLKCAHCKLLFSKAKLMLHYQNHHGGGKADPNTKDSQDGKPEFDPLTFKFEEGEGLREEDLPPNHVNDICQSESEEDASDLMIR